MAACRCPARPLGIRHVHRNAHSVKRSWPRLKASSVKWMWRRDRHCVQLTLHEETGLREGPYRGRPHHSCPAIRGRTSAWATQLDGWLVAALLMPQASCICKILKIQSWNFGLFPLWPNGTTCAPALPFPQPWNGRMAEYAPFLS